jgi:hypothetical protein
MDCDSFIGKACAITLILVFPALSFCASSSSWHGLNLRETTSTQAIAILGRPAKDQRTELGRLVSIIPGTLRTFVDPEHKHDAARLLTFSAVDSFRAVSLGFINDKLILIELAPDKGNIIRVDDLKTTYPDCAFGDPVSTPIGDLSLFTQLVGFSASTTAGVLGTFSPVGNKGATILQLFDSVTFPGGHVGKAEKSLQ